MPKAAKLRRVIHLPALVLYGLGNILGAGIYVLVGEVAGVAGLFAPVAFLLASIVAAITALSYAELSARFPLSAGEAVYVQQGFNNRQLALLVGVLIMLSGLVSSATLARGFVGYLELFVQLPSWLNIMVVVGVLGLVAVWGIRQSVGLAALVTLAEVVGLLIIIYVARDAYTELPQRWSEFVPSLQWTAWHGIILGGFLAFYAFIGFEDMVNVAEEVRAPHKTMPRAIFIVVIVSTLLYGAVALAAIMVVSPAQLQASHAPLGLVYERATGQAPDWIGLISLLAIINGVLIQIIMASRVAYGMAKQGLLPNRLARVSLRTHTPILATLMVTVTIMVLALAFPLVTLAQLTSFFILLVFILIHLSLWKLRRDQGPEPGLYRNPLIIPLLGVSLCSGFVIYQLLTLFGLYD